MGTFNATIELEWATGTHRFRLPIGQVLELQERCNAGLQEIFRRLCDGTWRANDIAETIRLGLIGGGMAPLDAATIVSRYCHNRPWAESWPVALKIVENCIVGVPGDQPGKPAADRTTAEPIGSPPAIFTVPAAH